MSKLAIAVATAFVVGCGGGRSVVPTTPVRFIGEGQPGPLARRLAVELDAAKIRAILLEGFGLPDTELARLARRQAAPGGVLVQRGPGRAQRLVIFVLTEGGAISRQVVQPGAGESIGELVLRVVETLRAELLPLPDLPFEPRQGTTPHSRPMATSLAASRPARAPDASRRALAVKAPVGVAKASSRSLGAGPIASSQSPRDFSLSVSGGVTYGPGGLDPLAQVGLALGWCFAAQWEVRARALLPVGAGRLEAASGSSDLYPALASVSIDWLPLSRRRRFALHLGLGAGVGLLHALGKASAPFVARGETAWAAHLAADGGISVALHPRWFLRLDLLLGSWIPRPQVVIGNDIAGSWGQPFFHASLGIEAKL